MKQELEHTTQRLVRISGLTDERRIRRRLFSRHRLELDINFVLAGRLLVNMTAFISTGQYLGVVMFGQRLQPIYRNMSVESHCLARSTVL